jgi:hypothetical protein
MSAFQILRDNNPEASRCVVTVAIQPLTISLLIRGRPTHRGRLREPINSYGYSRYVALFRFAIESDDVRVLAIRQEREVSFRP